MPRKVLIPERLAQPLELHGPWWRRPRVTGEGGAELPTDRWGNPLATSADGRSVRVEPDWSWSQLAPAVRLDDERVLAVPELSRPVRIALLGFAAAAFLLGGALTAGLGLGAAILAAALLRKGGSRPVRYAQALGVILGAVLVWLAVLLILRPAVLGG